jgi:hypothetical protein
MQLFRTSDVQWYTLDRQNHRLSRFFFDELRRHERV